MTHLSSRQISEVLMGVDSPFTARHVRECTECAGEIERLELPLTWFRSSVRQWSEKMDRQLDYESGAARFETAPVLLLTPETLDQPWYRSILQAIREAIHPPDRPPLVVTSKPVEVPSVWGFFGGHEKTAGMTSVMLHAAVIALLLFLGSLKPVQKFVANVVPLVAPDLKPYKPEANKGGGGGGAKQPLDASKGKLPPLIPKVFMPNVDTAQSKLPMTPTIVSDVPIPNIDAANYGDTLSRLGVPSNGTGLGGGIGTGTGGGVGPGHGPGVGPGSGGGFGGGAYKIGGGVSQPMLISKIEPEYSEEARKAKWQGTVEMQIVVDEHGVPKEMRVTRALGLGLDQKAMEAVAKWRFKPGMKDGKPVPVIATVQVNFRLL